MDEKTKELVEEYKKNLEFEVEFQKRLIQAQSMGISIGYSGQELVLNFVDNESEQYLEVDNDPFIDIVERERMTFKSRISGSIFDALNYIDYILKKCGQKTLLDRFKESEKTEEDPWGIEFSCDHGFADDKEFEDKVSQVHEEEWLKRQIMFVKADLYEMVIEENQQEKKKEKEEKLVRLQRKLQDIRSGVKETH